MKKILLAAILLSQTSYSMISEPYMRARQIDLAVTEMATNYFKYEVDQAPIASIKYITGGIAVGIGSYLCNIRIETKHLPEGAVGVPGYSAVIDNNQCGVIRAYLPVTKYGEIKNKINAAAAKGKSIVEVQIPSPGKIKLLQK